MAALAVIVPLVIAVAGVPFIAGGEEYRKSFGTISWVLAGHWLAILYLAWLALRGSEPISELPLPKVRAYQKTYGYLMVEKASWLGQGVLVSLYRVEDQFERFLCFGSVENIQENGLAAILPTEIESGPTVKDLVEVFDRSDLTDILVKPGIRRNV